MRLRNIFLVALMAGSFAASGATAAPVNFTLDLTGAPGTFNLFAEETGGGFGMASYNVLLTGPLLSVDHNSPSLTFGTKGTFNGAAGFNQFRSADSPGAPVTPFAVGSSQNTIDTAAPTNLVGGYGQTAGSFTGSGFTPILAGSDPQSWNAKLLLASGTWDTGAPGDALPGFNSSSVEVFSNIFLSQDLAGTESAQLQFTVLPPIGNDTTPPVIAPQVINVAWPNTVSNFQLVASDPDDAANTLIWSNIQNPPSGPGSNGGSGVASLTAGGLFSWDPTGWRGGAHTFTASVKDVANNSASGLAITVNYTVPEPTTFALGGIALVGLVGLARRRS